MSSSSSLSGTSQEQARQPFSLRSVRQQASSQTVLSGTMSSGPSVTMSSTFVVENVGGDHLSPLRSHG